MFKLIKSFFSFLLTLFLFLFIFFWIKKESYIEKCFSNVLQTEVSVGNVSLDGFGLKIRHMVINNPIGFPTQLGAFEAENIILKISIKDLIQGQLSFPVIKINKASINILFYNKQANGHNWSCLLQRETSLSNSIKIHIKKCKITSLSCHVYKYNKRTPISMIIPYLEFCSKQYPTHYFKLPSFPQAVRSLLYLSLDEIIRNSTLHSFYFKDSSISSEANYFFESSYSQLSQQALTQDSKIGTEFSLKKDCQDTLNFLKEIFFE